MKTSNIREDEGAEISATAKGPMRRTRLTRERQCELISQWQQSGLSRAEFCRQHGLCYGSFGIWIEREKEATGGGGTLVEVRLRENEVDLAGMELIAPNGWRVRLQEGFEEASLIRLLNVMSRC